MPDRLALRLPIHTQRLLLRPFDRDRDVDAFHVYRSLPELCRYAPIEPVSRAQVVERLGTDTYTRTELEAEGDVLALAVEERATGVMIGDVVLFWRSQAHMQAEIGYTISPSMQGRGYATEAARGLADAVFAELPIHRLAAVIDERHKASLAVARQLGMRLEARRVECQLLKGEWVTLTEWAVLDRDWRAG